jgi:ribosomal protein S18 acetylase RimI-like enzyme
LFYSEICFMKTLTIQQAEPGDRPFLRAMNWEAVLASPGFIQEYGLEKLQQQEDDYWLAWTPENGPAFIAVDPAGHQLGAIVLKSHEPDSVPPRGWRFGIGIVEAARGQGVGHNLIEHSLDFARASGAHYLTLFVDPANRPAVNLYKKMGFHPAGQFGSLVEMRLEF